MLVLSRHVDEAIMVGDDVEITVLEIRGVTVRLGIMAPKAVGVHRAEVFEAIQRQNGDAARTAGQAPDRVEGTKWVDRRGA